MQITSPAFANGDYIPSKYTCEGENISPPLKFEDVPSETESLVLLVEDLSVKNRPWVHWVVFNIPPNAHGFEEGHTFEGSTLGLANGSYAGYKGPCPEDKEHEYQFSLFALDKILNIPEASDRAVIVREMRGHIIAQDTLRGKFVVPAVQRMLKRKEATGKHERRH